VSSVGDFGQAQGVQVIARLDSSTYRPLQRLGLTVDITIDAGLHVYGQPIPEGFIPVSIDVAPLAGLVVETLEFPAPALHRLEGLEEDFYIYEGTLTVTIPLTFSQAVDDPTISLMVGYQACSDAAGCFMPQKIQLRLPVQAEDQTG
jgi:DsbC/DsbD-like thiol-disulfide interchange protein